MALRRFEFQDGESNKFWEVGVIEQPKSTMSAEAKLYRRWGKIGTQGQTSVTQMRWQQARDEMYKLIDQKLGKGYREVKAFAVNAPPEHMKSPPEPNQRVDPAFLPAPVPVPAAKEEPHRPRTLDEIRARFKA